MHFIIRPSLLALIVIGLSCSDEITPIDNTPADTTPPDVEFTIRVPAGENSWISDQNSFAPESTDNLMISEEGITNWSLSNQIIHTYFHCSQPGEIYIALRTKSNPPTSTIEVSIGGQHKQIELTTSEYDDSYVGKFNITKAGYQELKIRGLSKSGNEFADVKEIALSIPDDMEVNFAKDDFHWARRGPSVQLFFNKPEHADDIEWYFSEILVPENQDVIGSYFMANGFDNGYFGIQVNSEEERRILFSVWSPYTTDDPDSIPEEYKIKLIKKGEHVITGEFGNEGAGGQSYKNFNWKTGQRYGFLLGATPNGDNSTNYIAYFFDPESQQWSLLAQFQRPFTDSYLTQFYSFLENFKPCTGAISRKAYYGNQWAKSKSVGWQAVTQAIFYADQTAVKKNRLDYSGGKHKDGFYLKNCGFTNENTALETPFTRTADSTPPNIPFSELE